MAGVKTVGQNYKGFATCTSILTRSSRNRRPEPEIKKETLEPFVRPTNVTPSQPPKMEEPKPFIPKPLAQTPPISLNPTPPQDERVVETEKRSIEPLNQNVVSDEEQQARVKSRMNKLKDLSRRLRTASGLGELEDVPAYQRRAVTLEDTPHSSESQVSKYTLDDSGTEGERKTNIGNNNSFLHDNVD